MTPAGPAPRRPTGYAAGTVHRAQQRSGSVALLTRAVVGLRALGDLEAAVMDALWSAAGALRVRDVVDALKPARPVAYTTAMTVLDNLHRKGWVTREMHARAYHYTARWSREEATARALRQMLDDSRDPEAALLHFARSVSSRESQLLREALTRPDQGP